MAPERMDPRLLNAFADSELTPEEAARVVMHLADCPEDQTVVDGIMMTNALLARACAGPLDEPVPPAIRAAIFGAPPERTSAQVTPFRRPAARTAFWGAALAAGLAAAAVFLPRLAEDGGELALGPVPARNPIAEALTELASGETQLVARDVELAMVASYAVPGGFCREFTLHTGPGAVDLAPDLVGLACNEGAGWQVAAREAEPAPHAQTHFVPAAGDAEDAIRSGLDAHAAGPALSAEEERAARAAGWR